MNNTEFGERLAMIRTKSGKSARELSAGINKAYSYINNIELGKSYPTMSVFFEICDYLRITPKDFFNYDLPEPVLLHQLMATAQSLNGDQLKTLLTLSEMITVSKNTKTQ